MATLDFEQKVEQTMHAIEESDLIHPRNKVHLKKWRRDLSLADLSMATIQKRTAHMKVVAEHLDDTEFTELEKDRMKNLVEWIQSRDTSQATIESYKKIIRFFWKWLAEQEDFDFDDDGYPEVVAWIDPDSRVSNDVLPQNLLTQDDIQDQIEAAYNARDKALIALLWETGARIGELIDLTVGDIEDRQKGRKVVIDGKTGPRRVPLDTSVPHLNNWLTVHPSGEPDDPLWSKINSADGSVSYNYIRQKILEKTAEEAGIDKPVNPHHYRHSRATYLANHLTEAQMCEWFGWVQGSDQPAKYVHMSGRDIDDAYAELLGESTDDESVDSLADECKRCGEPNAHDTRYCGSCGFDLRTDVGDVQGEVWSREEVEEIVADAVQAAMEGEPGDPAPTQREDAIGTVEAATDANADTAAGPFFDTSGD